MAAVRQKYRRSYSLDSGLDSVQQQSHPGFLQKQGPQSSGYIWNAYFDDDMLAYQGLDEEWIDGSLSGSEAVGREDSEDEDNCTWCLQDTREQATDKKTLPISDAQQLDLPRRRQQDRIEGLGKRSEHKGLEALDKTETTLDSTLSAENHHSHISRQYSQAPIANASHSTQYEPWEIHIEAQDRETVDGPDGLRSDNGAQDALLDALENETDNILGAHLNPAISSPASGVEAARSAYNDGFLSTSTFHRDCLPPALCTKSTSTPVTTPNPYRSPFPKPTARGSTTPATSDEHEHADTDGPLPVVKRRNISERDQLRRFNQPPLSAIYEESSDAEAICKCVACSDAQARQGILWFHLCPRYNTIAREKGFGYESYEGRVLLHHSPDTESIGLIIEGPMEDRFIPATPASSASSTAQLPQPNAIEGSTEGIVAIAPGHTGKRSTSQTSQVSRSSSLKGPSLKHLSKEAESTVSQEATPKLREDSIARPVSTQSQLSIHPAFRDSVDLPKGWSQAPTRSQSLASMRDKNRSDSQIVGFKRLSNDSDPGQHPVRRDSLGAPTLLGNAAPCAKSFANHRANTGSLQHRSAHQSNISTSSSSVLSPALGHQRLPSTFLAPSTPSTASFARSSFSSYDENLPLTHIFQLREAGIIGTVEQHRAINPFLSSKEKFASTDYGKDEMFSPLFSPQSYHTAPAGQNERSPMYHSAPVTPDERLPEPYMAPAVHFNQPWVDDPQISGSGSPFVQPERCLHSQSSKQSIAESHASRTHQRNSAITSNISLLNGNPFDTNEPSIDDAVQGPDNNASKTPEFVLCNSSTYSDEMLQNLDTPEPQINSAGSSTPKQHDRGIFHDMVNLGRSVGLGITASPPAMPSRRTSFICPWTHDPVLPKPHDCRTMKPLPPLPAKEENPALSAKDELESYVGSYEAHCAPDEGLRRSVFVQQNLCSRPKLQQYFGTTGLTAPMAVGSPKRMRNGSKLLRAMTPGEVAKEKGFKGVVIRGGRKVREGGVSLKERFKRGWTVRGEDFLDDDD